MQHKILTSTLVNIDSSFRNINPKNIYISNNKTKLPLNPLIINKNIVTINYPNHNLQVGDNIMIQNVIGFNKIISNEIYLLNNFNYAIINLLEDNMIDNSASTENLYINIHIYGNLIESSIINNIPINNLIGIKNSLIFKNIPFKYTAILTKVASILNLNYKNCIFIQLYTEYTNNNIDYYCINQTFIIEYLHINGVPLGYLNADYPINNINFQSSYDVYKIIDNDTFMIHLKVDAYNNNLIGAGGDNIKINKIINSINGYPDANNYTINIKKTFTNVIDIKLVSSEFPYTDLLIKSNINDKLYWKTIEGGDIINIITIDEGSYTTTQLLNKLQKLMPSFIITIENNINLISFSYYNNINLPNCISVVLNDPINYILNIYHPKNILNVNDIITISKSTLITFKIVSSNNTQIYAIDGSYINNSFTITEIIKETNSYNVILGARNNITTSLINYESNGGEAINIRVPSKFSFLFNKNDTIGTELGFLNVGYMYSITDFKHTITNSDKYINDIQLNSIGNSIIYNNGFLNMVGKYNYFLMYLNNIEYIYSNNNINKPAFAKILLSGNPGDILFNTFVEQPNNLYDKSFPIPSLSSFDISFLYPDGNTVLFRNINHSFTLKIIEEKIQNNNTYLNSTKLLYKNDSNK
uniref:Uncharacterized protein n=1 Tax=viral metagenome TaxID=1070528 RepID=A0A6C0H945_9ZZZZ